MIEVGVGDLLNAPVEALVNTVNCDGIMGRGIALQFKRAFPENFKLYEAACKRGEVVHGKMFVVATGQLDGPKCIVNFPTKRHWRQKSKIEDIKAGLDDLVLVVRELGLKSIAIPPLGCGLGGLEWRDVRPLILQAFAQLPEVQTFVFAPNGAPDAKSMIHPPVTALTPARAVIIGLMERYLRPRLESFVTLLEVQKLSYFGQEAALLQRLNFKAHTYGPYADNLRHLLLPMEGTYVLGLGDGGENPDKQLELLPHAAKEAGSVISGSEVASKYDRVVDLVEGFETAFGLELLATVHWVVKHEEARSLNEVVRVVHGWSPRKKRMFNADHIAIAHQTLLEKKWLTFPAVA